MLRAAILAASLTLAAPALAQTGPTGLAESEANPDPVFVFNRVCYSQVPSVQAIRDMAFKLAWKSMEAEELEQFRAYDNATVLDGWDAQVGERIFRVAITQAPAPQRMTESFDGFAEATATTCTMILDDQQDPAVFMANMQTLAGKETLSSNVPEGNLRTTTWAGGNEEIKVFLVAKAAAEGGGGLLNVTVLQK